MTPDLFVKLGLFVRQGFLDAPGCAGICAEMVTAPSEMARVAKDGEGGVDSTVRRTLDVQVPASTRGRMEGAIDALVPVLDAHFGGPLARAEGLHFLRYRPGDFFAPHRDAPLDPAAAPRIQPRHVSIVLFLNACAGEPLSGQFSGGALKLFGLMKEPAFAPVGFPLHAETGMLVAFPSDLLHAVEPVTVGERLSVVAWLRRA